MKLVRIILSCYLAILPGFAGIRCFAITFSNDTADSKKHDSLVVSADYFSRAFYSGRNWGIEQVGLNPSLAFYQKTGLNFRIYGYGMGTTPGLVGLIDFGVSYKINLFPNLSFTPGFDYLYNRFEINKELFLAADLGVTWDFKGFSVNNYVGFSFGGSRSCWYDEVALSKYFNLYYREKVSLAVSPTFSGIFGTKFFQTLIYDSQIDSTFSINSYEFMPLCIGMQIPVVLFLKPVSITVSPHYDIPLNVARPLELNLPGNPFYLTCKISCTIPLKKRGR